MILDDRNILDYDIYLNDQLMKYCSNYMDGKYSGSALVLNVVPCDRINWKYCSNYKIGDYSGPAWVPSDEPCESTV